MRRTRLSRSSRKMRKSRLQSAPTYSRVWIEHIVEESPDLSWLETKMEGDRIVDSARYTNDDIKKYGLAKVKQWIAHDQARLESYGRDWVMIGVIAKAEVLLPKRTIPPSSQIQVIQSGGLWGIESDSDKKTMQDFNKEQLEDLKENLAAFGVNVKKFPRVEDVEVKE